MCLPFSVDWKRREGLKEWLAHSSSEISLKQRFIVVRGGNKP
jgi:hypothetical protein